MATFLPLSHMRASPPRLHPTCGKSVPNISLHSFISLHNHRVLPRVVTTRAASIQSIIQTETGLQELSVQHSKLRNEFLQLLRTRRSPEVPLKVEPAKLELVIKPISQVDPLSNFNEVTESYPIEDITIPKEQFVEEKLYLHTEASDQGRVPVLIVSMEQTTKSKRPAVVLMHFTGGNKESLLPRLEDYASRGYIAVAIDARYHGERADSTTSYSDALVSAWKYGDTMPFIFDTVWDLTKLADYLTFRRDDIDSARIGIFGISLGGMHAWFAAFADPRYAVVAPIIGVQGFRWAIDNDKWQARVDSIKSVFEVARIDLGKSEIDAEVVEKVWDRIAPGLASQFDAPYTIPAIVRRPLLIINGADDPRCPIGGVVEPKARAEKAYKSHNSSKKFKLIAEPGVAHEVTSLMTTESSDWFDRFL